MTDELSQVDSAGLEPEIEATSVEKTAHAVGAGDSETALSVATEVIKSGKCVVFPTDTVYGIAADAFSADAVQNLLAAKQRGADMPPPVLIAEPGMLRALVSDAPALVYKLAKEFWPGALTIIVNAQRSLELQIGDTAGSVAIRVPDHEVARNLLRRTGPLAVSSANISGQPPARTVADAVAQLGDEVSFYLDGGELGPGEVSTIVDFTASEKGRVLRQGAISYDQLVAIAPEIEPMSPAKTDLDTDSQSDLANEESAAESDEPDLKQSAVSSEPDVE